MTERTVNVEPQQVNWLLDQIEKRLDAIGKVYYQDGQAYSHDLEISALRRLAVQLGYDFDVRGARDCFELTRYEVNLAK